MDAVSLASGIALVAVLAYLVWALLRAEAL